MTRDNAPSNLDPVTFITPIIGAVIGFLISFPVLTPSTGSTMVLLLSTIVGGLIGYKRRNSRAFFYFSLVVALVLLSIIYPQMLATTVSAPH